MYNIQISGEKFGTWQYVSGNEYTSNQASAEIAMLREEYPGRAFRIVKVREVEPVTAETRALFASL